MRRILAGLAVLALAPSGHAVAEPPRLSAKYAQFVHFARPKVPRTVEFRTVSGSTITLEAFRGKVVLLNFWATWCPPCVWEMPSLDRLQAKLGGDRPPDKLSHRQGRTRTQLRSRGVEMGLTRSHCIFAVFHQEMTFELRARDIACSDAHSLFFEPTLSDEG